MAETYSTELTSVLDGTLPASKADGSVYGARVRRYRSTITLASGTLENGDTVVLAKPKDGEVFAYGIITQTNTFGASATIAIGTTDDPDGYRAAATYTATNTPTFFGHTAGLTEGALDGDTEVKLTVGAANGATSGTIIIDLFYSHS